MWMWENGKRVENPNDILYSMNILDGFARIINMEFISESEIFGYYNQIMKLEKEDRVPELINLERQLILENGVLNGTISEKIAKEIFEAMKKGKFIYKINTEKQTIDCFVGEYIEKDAEKTHEEMLDEKTVSVLFKLAKVIPMTTYERYIFFMEMLTFDKDKRAEEVEKAYNQLTIEDFVTHGFLTEEEGSNLIEKIGQSQLLENWNSVLEEFEEDEEEYCDEDVAEDTV